MGWVSIATAPNEPIGESWAQILREEGIPAFVRGEAWLRVYVGPGLPSVQVMVPEEAEARARRLLEDLLGPDEERPPEP